MGLIYNPYIWIYLISAIMLSFIIIYSFYNNIKDLLWIATLSMVILWCVGFAAQISAADIKSQFFWYALANDFIGLKSPTVLLLWALKVTGRRKAVTPYTAALFLVLPVVTDILNLTNSNHGLMYGRLWLNTYSGYPLLSFSKGLWYWIITVYCMVELIVVVSLFYKSSLNRQLLYRRQGYALAVFVFIVFLFIMYMLIFDGAIFRYYDLTPVIISAVAVCFSFAFRFRKQEVIPVPRNDVIEKMDSAVLILDNHNRIMDMNNTAEEYFGFKSETVSGDNISVALGDWPELVDTDLNKSNNYCEFSRNNRFYKAYFSNLKDERKSAGNVVIVQDVTDYKQAELRALEQEQALIALQERSMLARELHDSLGQVLGYINMQLQLIREMLKTGHVQKIDSSLGFLSKVIEEANIEVREFIYEVRTTLIFKDGFFPSLHQYISHIVQNFNINIEIQNPHNLSDDDIGLPEGVQLFRIIQEAVTNVRKHANAKKVELVFRQNDESVIVSVSDDGIGFNPEKVNNQSSFGLEVMKERASYIGGEFIIDTAPGRGTTIKVVLPKLNNSRIRSETGDYDNGITSDTSKIKVLLVDDHALFMDGLQNLIEPHGFEVVGTAKDGLEAIEKARKLGPDMILMDLQMPRCNGITATRMINMEMPNIKIIILTMSDREYDLFEALKNGASGYLLKSLSTEDFIGQLLGIAANGTVISPEMASQVIKEFNFDKNKPSITDQAYKAQSDAILSQRQVEILSLIAKGNTYKEVAAKLFISERTVKYEMSDIIKRLHLQNRSEAIAYARECGLFQ